MAAYTPDEPEGGPQDPGMSDEGMLEKVRQGMGGGQPPPGSGMKWQDLADDQNALVADPSPENVQAFVQYWGENNLPEELGGSGDMARAEPGIQGPMPSNAAGGGMPAQGAPTDVQDTILRLMQGNAGRMRP